MNAANTPTLKTERLILRRFTENDIEILYSILKDEEVNHFLPWFPLKNLKEAEDFFEQRYSAVYRQACGYRYAICLKSDNVPIGYVNVSIDNNHDLGYGLKKEYWHKGITTEAGSAVLNQVRKDGFLYVTATHDVKNPRSGNVMKQLGMNYMYSYNEQVQPKNVLVTFRLYQLNFAEPTSYVFRGYCEETFIETDV